jgi:hypothetical protein
MSGRWSHQGTLDCAGQRRGRATGVCEWSHVNRPSMRRPQVLHSDTPARGAAPRALLSRRAVPAGSVSSPMRGLDWRVVRRQAHTRQVRSRHTSPECGGLTPGDGPVCGLPRWPQTSHLEVNRLVGRPAIPGFGHIRIWQWNAEKGAERPGCSAGEGAPRSLVRVTLTAQDCQSIHPLGGRSERPPRRLSKGGSVFTPRARGGEAGGGAAEPACTHSAVRPWHDPRHATATA